MNTRAEQAMAYLEALALGAVTVEEIVDWADAEISADEEPDIVLIELALSKSRGDVVTYLNQLQTQANEEQSFRILFGLLYRALENKRCSHIDVARRLYFWSAYETQLSGFSALQHFWDALGLAEDGIYGDVAQIRGELLEFLRANKSE